MRRLSFETFLKHYLIDASGQQSLSIHKLVKLSGKNTRIVDPLILYCLFKDRMEVLFKYIDINTKSSIINLSKENFLNDKFVNYSFQKIYKSYERKTKVNEFDNETKNLARSSILKLMKEKGITNYRVYKDLKANPGNVNDYLKNGNMKKVSLKLVKDIYNYCQSR